MKHFVFIFFLLIAEISAAQPELELLNYQDRYPKVLSVTQQNNIVLHVDIVDDSLQVYRTEFERMFYLTDRASLLKDGNLSYDSFTDIINWEASVYLPTKKKYKKVKVKEYTETDAASGQIFHDDVKHINFTYEGLQKGCKTELKYTELIKDPHFINREFLAWFLPIENLSFKVITHPDVEMGFATYHIDPAYITYREYENNEGKKVYEWTVKDARVFNNEDWAPSVAWYIPHVIPYIKTYSVNGETKPVLRDVADLFRWYNSFVDTLNSEEAENPDTRALVDSIVAGAGSETEKVKRIFQWTQANIKYIAYESGMGGFVPRPADYVCTNRFGDCKDMSSTITHLLKYAGIKSHLTWIGTTKLPYRYSDVPTPVVDNHMIATYISPEGDYYFLDATGRYNEFGKPSEFIQGKEALIKISNDSFLIKKVPVVPSEDNKILYNITLKNDESGLQGKGSTFMSGYYKINLAYTIEDMDVEKKKNFYREYFGLGNNKFILKNFMESHFFPDSEPFQVDFDFEIGDYVIENKDEKYINLNLLDVFTGQKIEKDRDIPVQNNYMSCFEIKVKFDIPEGYKVEHLPESQQFVNEYLDFFVTYTVEGGVINYHMKANMNFLDLTTPEQFEKWNEGNGLAAKAMNEVVVLKKL